ncbi:hypothetical protein [Acinetobacter sp. UBA6720]|uniref:hypothetical protein n=1 Tax=Acinetobacter sp. UBA6720 TaxID=1945953 RepID=UPI0025C6DC94|nr:hypothetical protein [Acinetobacter sp. UBA6720]
MFDNKKITDEEMFLLFKHKYQYEICAGKDDEISIFKDWFCLFDALNQLKQMSTDNAFLEEFFFQNSEKLRELFFTLCRASQTIFNYKHEIHFDLFNIFKSSLDEYDKENVATSENAFLHSLQRSLDTGVRLPVEQYLHFYSIFKNQLAIRPITNGMYSLRDQTLFSAQQKIGELFKRYGGLYVFNVSYQFRHASTVTSKDKILELFKDVELIEQNIVSDRGLLKVLFNFEDDGVHGCLLNCIVIYPLQLYKNTNGALAQLQRVAENCAENSNVRFQDLGPLFKKICGKDIVGVIDDNEKLENFLYWSIGSFYRYEDFFHYCIPSIRNDYIHKQVMTPWTIMSQVSRIGVKPKPLQLTQDKLMNFIKDKNKVWSISVLPKVQRQQLIVDEVLLVEMSYEFGDGKNLTGEILYFLDVFYAYLKINSEAFFHFEVLDDVIVDMKLSRMGRQLIYLISLFSQQSNLINEIEDFKYKLNIQFHLLFKTALWEKIKELAHRGSAVLTQIETFGRLNQFSKSYKTGELGPMLLQMPSTYLSIDLDKELDKDLISFRRRYKDAQESFAELLKSDQLICRFKFYADVSGESFLDKKEVFAKNFTEFLRKYRRNSVLRNLKGYFLVWLNNPHREVFGDKSIEPYVDVIFVMECEYRFDIQSFLQELSDKWINFKGKSSCTDEDGKLFRALNLKCEPLMYSDESLNSRPILFDKKNRKLKKALLEKLLLYFTYRHFYLPKVYDDLTDKRTKMFSKGH